MYPQQTFPNFNALLTYINTEWVTNGNGDITGVVGNNVVNGLLTFIEQSPLNYQKTAVIDSNGAVVVSHPVNVFVTKTPSALSWPNNIYNQLVFINTTEDAVPLLSGFYYRDIDLNAVQIIPAKRVMILYKMANDEWVQGVTYSANPGAVYTPDELQFEVGVGVPPVMVDGETQLIVTATNVDPKSLLIFLDGSFLYKNRVDRISYTVVYNPLNFIVTFNQAVANGQLYEFNYGKNI